MVGLVFGVLERAWNTAVGASVYGANAFFTSAIRQNLRGRSTETPSLEVAFGGAFQSVHSGRGLCLGPVPDILRWSIQLSIFAVLLVPLFNELALSFGSHIAFGHVLKEAERLHFARAAFDDEASIVPVIVDRC